MVTKENEPIQLVNDIMSQMYHDNIIFQTRIQSNPPYCARKDLKASLFIYFVGLLSA